MGQARPFVTVSVLVYLDQCEGPFETITEVDTHGVTAQQASIGVREAIVHLCQVRSGMEGNA